MSEQDWCGARTKGRRKYDDVTRTVTKPFSSFKMDGFTSRGQCNIIPVDNVERMQFCSQ